MATKIQHESTSDSSPIKHPLLELDGFIPYRLNMLASLVADRFARSYASYSERFGIDGPRWRVISFLGERRHLDRDHPAMTARDICAKTRMTKAMVSRAIGELESTGLIRRHPNENDRREAFLEVTGSGMRVYRTIAPVARKFQEQLFADLTSYERRMLFHIIDKLQDKAHSM